VSRVDVGVIGGGIIGLAIAWRCAQRGLSVRVHDPDPGAGASHAAAGMLAPVGESTFGEVALTELLVESARRWPAFAAELTAATGIDCGYRAEGTLTVAMTGDDLAEAERLWAYQRGLGLGVTPLRPTALRDREPALSPRVRGGALSPDDHQVDPRRVIVALCAALEARGVTPVRKQSKASDVDARTVVVAAGCGTTALTGVPVRPVKGQILRLRGPALLTHVIRGYADGLHVYLVPRADGEVVVGATMEERTDRTVTAGGVLDLLRAATALVPDIAEFELVETLAAHRPATPDNLPVLGRLRSTGTIVAAGHFRHGVLLTPVTADLITDLVTGGGADERFTPNRFTPARNGTATCV
jgi:glycine oxidase